MHSKIRHFELLIKTLVNPGIQHGDPRKEMGRTKLQPARGIIDKAARGLLIKIP